MTKTLLKNIKMCRCTIITNHAIYREIFSAVNIEIFIGKNFAIFNFFAQNIDCGYTLEPPRRGGSNEYPQSMFWSKIKRNRYTPAYPSFFYIKVGFNGVCITWTCFPDVKLPKSYEKLYKVTSSCEVN